MHGDNVQASIEIAVLASAMWRSWCAPDIPCHFWYQNTPGRGIVWAFAALWHDALESGGSKPASTQADACRGSFSDVRGEAPTVHVSNDAASTLAFLGKGWLGRGPSRGNWNAKVSVFA